MLLWRYRRKRPDGASVPHETNRGIALFGDKVYFAAGEAVLVALDAKTGKEVWTSEVADNRATYYITLAPLIAGGAVMVGASGGEFGIRGFVAAFRSRNRQRAVENLYRAGARRTRQRDLAERRRMEDAAARLSGSPEITTLKQIWHTLAPATAALRSATIARATISTPRRRIAFDVATGAMKGYFQYHPNDSWDYDEVSPPILVDYQA